MSRRILTRFALPVMVLVTIYAIFQTRGGTGVHISGDLAADLRASLESALPGLDDARAPDAARLEVIAVTEWSKLAFVPDALRACGAPCSPESPLRLVRVINLAPGRSRKQVFLNIEAALDTGLPGPRSGQRGAAYSRGQGSGVQLSVSGSTTHPLEILGPLTRC